ncbi:CBS domain-containing protein [Brevundimonas sp.]|uniref:CBS domain-containing protein n=1 Tax=Brevundimonas sp. TaxID=1871086 RepID=UPI0025ECA60C|nr:CBS domain-containing protein [Brevundimonas sp.]
MKINEVMSRDVQVANPQDTIQSVAQRMAQGDFGFMPVCDGQRLQGTVTDRDLTVRALAEGKSFDTPVAEVMSRDVHWLREGEDVKTALEFMGDKQIRRLPVIDETDRLVGVVALGDLARTGKDRHSGDALQDISKP